MNPFEWRGPQFLGFYAFLSVALVFVLHHWRRAHWRRQPANGRLNLADPYEVAYLRGGRNEAIRIAAIALVERGLLEVRDKIELVTTVEGLRTKVTDPLEAALLSFFKVRRQAADPFKVEWETWEHALGPRRERLERAGLLADAGRRAFRKRLGAIGSAILLGVASLKVWIALSAGRRNIAFLVLLTIMGTLALLMILWAYRRTPLGDTTLAESRQLFDRHAVTHLSSAEEILLVAAVFGVAALPAGATPYVPELYPQAMKRDSAGGCGSSCGSSCGGGGGCGGGGCGGCGG